MPVNRRARAIAVGSVLALTVALFSLEYTVKRGDTLSEIARDHDVSLSDVVELNEISNPDLIRPGQVILIPGVDGSVEQVHVVSMVRPWPRSPRPTAPPPLPSPRQQHGQPRFDPSGSGNSHTHHQEEVTGLGQPEPHRWRERVVTIGSVPHRSAWRDPGLHCRAVLGCFARHHCRRQRDHQRKGLHRHPSLPRRPRLRGEREWRIGQLRSADGRPSRRHRRQVRHEHLDAGRPERLCPMST